MSRRCETMSTGPQVVERRAGGPNVGLRAARKLAALMATVACSATPIKDPAGPPNATGGSGAGNSAGSRTVAGTGAAEGGATGHTGGTKTLELVSQRVEIETPILPNKRGTARMARLTTGYRITLEPSPRETWAGYCWEWPKSLVDGRPYDALKVELAEVSSPMELEFKLECSDNSYQDRVIAVASEGTTVFPRQLFPKTFHAIARFCMVNAVPEGGRRQPTTFEVRRVWLE